MAVEQVFVILDQAPDHEMARFVEVESAEGRSAIVPSGADPRGGYEGYWRIGPLYVQTGEGAPGVSEERGVRARLAVNELEALIAEHEQAEHGGEACLDERTGMVAFLAHVLGLRVEHLRQVGYALSRYQEEHDRLHGEHEHRHLDRFDDPHDHGH